MVLFPAPAGPSMATMIFRALSGAAVSVSSAVIYYSCSSGFAHRVLHNWFRLPGLLRSPIGRSGKSVA